MLVHGEQRRHLGLLQHGVNRIVVGVPTTCVDDLYGTVHVEQRLSDLAVHQTVDLEPGPPLPTRRVDKYELGFVDGVNTEYLITGSLRFARGNADLLAENAIQKC